MRQPPHFGSDFEKGRIRWYISLGGETTGAEETQRPIASIAMDSCRTTALRSKRCWNRLFLPTSTLPNTRIEFENRIATGCG
jgi:hypothetical protein